MKDFSGTGVAVITPFTQDQQLDIPALRKILRHLIAAKVDYVVALGTTAETPVLTKEEKSAILDIFFEESEGQVPVVIGSGGNNTKEICQEISEFDTLYHPAGFLSVCPYYSKPSQKGLYEHFQAIAHITDLPIILYNIPGRTGVNLSTDTIIQLADSFHHIVAVKECSGNMQQGMQIMNSKPTHFQLLGGDDMLSLPLMSIGATGVISVLANALPRSYVQMIDYARSNNFEKARKIFYEMQLLMEICFEEGNPTGIKTIMKELGLCHSYLRLPNVSASEKLQEKISKELTSVKTDASSNF